MVPDGSLRSHGAPVEALVLWVGAHYAPGGEFLGVHVVGVSALPVEEECVEEVAGKLSLFEVGEILPRDQGVLPLRGAILEPVQLKS